MIGDYLRFGYRATLRHVVALGVCENVRRSLNKLARRKSGCKNLFRGESWTLPRTETVSFVAEILRGRLDQAAVINAMRLRGGRDDRCAGKL